MSWDVMVLNCHGNPPKDLSELPDDFRTDPLGAANDVRNTISNALPDVDWSDPTWGISMGDGFSLEFNVGVDDPIESMMVHVRGGGDAIASLVRFSAPNAWSLLDCSTSEFIDPDKPSQEGWEGFQAFRDKIIKQHRDTEEN